MICEEVIKVLEKQAPERYACDWDNVGLLIGSGRKEIKRIYVALDADDWTVAEAAAAGADLLLTHHPMIFRGMKRINDTDFIGRRVIELIKNDIAYYAMHTNFDISRMADLAADRMGLCRQAALQVFRQEETLEIGIGKMGMLPKKETLENVVEAVKKAFEVDTVKVFVDAMDTDFMKRKVERIAICPGSGKSVIKDALAAGAQVLVTGDIDHHEGIDAAACGMIIIDAGHYGVEKLFVPYMKQYLEASLPGIQVMAQEARQPFVYR